MTPSDLLSLLVCPACRNGELSGLRGGLSSGEAACSACGTRYPIRHGIPVLLPANADYSRIHDELDHASGHKRQQAGFFDRGVAEEFEVTRPHGAPAAYRWLLSEKFRRATTSLPPLRGATVLDACCGSGLDAELLARAGARVIALDISEGCARRARERARRFGLDYLAVVGDVERLPLRDRSVDVSFVHDGLHHLEHPLAGVRELARVARGAVSVNEPADAFATQVAVALRLAANREAAGNRVARLRAEEVSGALAAAGFRARSQRYLMYYGHEPGPLMRIASRPGAHQLYRWTMGASNATVGRWGNKLQVTGLRAA